VTPPRCAAMDSANASVSASDTYLGGRYYDSGFW
jgi:hypothetical protein